MTTLFSSFFFFFGAICASFIGVIAERVYTGQSFTKGRSKCDACTCVLGPLDLVPILSWLASAGKCRMCGSAISIRLFLLEVSLAVVFLGLFTMLGFSAELPLFLVFACILAFIVVYDLRHTLVPVQASVPLVVVSLVHAFLFRSGIELGGALVWAGALGFGFFLLHVLSKGRAMGLGDTPVVFALSLMIAPYAFSGVLFSFWSGALVGVCILFCSRGGPKMGIEIPFVPFLALGFFLAYLFQWTPL